jgi:histidine triad (HIT) family protein
MADIQDCPFCVRIANDDYEQRYNGTVVRLEPLNPVTPGHRLFVPVWHAEHPSGPAVRIAMGYAEYYGGHQGGDFNLITSSGSAATQTILHIHVHYVPRRTGDGLRLPWTPYTRGDAW